MARRTHPFRLWLDERKLTYAEAAAICISHGHPASDAYLQQIAIRWRRPSYDFAKFLSKKLTRGAVTVHDFMEFPLLKRSA